MRTYKMGIDTHTLMLSQASLPSQAQPLALGGAIVLLSLVLALPWVIYPFLAARFFPKSLSNPFGKLLFLPWLIWHWFFGPQRLRTLRWWFEILGNYLSVHVALVALVASMFCFLQVASTTLEFSAAYFMKSDEKNSKNDTSSNAPDRMRLVVLKKAEAQEDDTSNNSQEAEPSSVATTILSWILKLPDLLTNCVQRLFELFAILSYLHNFFATPLASIFLLYIGVHCFLFYRFSYVPHDVPSHSEPRLIPTQLDAFHEIMTRLRLQDRSGEPLVIAVDGEWGVGKSWLMREVCRVLTPRGRLAIFDLKQAANLTSWEAARARIIDILRPDWRPACHDLHLPNDQSQREFVFVFVNAWEYATEHDLHWGLFESLLKHSLVPAPWSLLGTNFLLYPLITLPVFAMRALVQAFDRGQFSLPGGFSFSFSLSGMLWQPQIDLIIDELRACNRQIVWCLDEIDRSSPEMAQAAITMTRRFLDQHGSIVIIPYVAQQLNFKVFHPLVATRPDLEGNMLAVLFQQLQQQIEDKPKDPQLQARLGLQPDIPMAQKKVKETKDDPQSPNENKDDSQAGHELTWEHFGIKSVIPSQLGQLPADVLARLTAAEPAGSLARRLRWLLLVNGISGNTASQQQRFFWFEEKYVRQAYLRLSRLSGRDVVSLFLDHQVSFPQIHEPVWDFLRLFSRPGLEEEKLRNEVFGIIKQRLEPTVERAIRLRSAGSGKRPVLRHFLDELRTKLVQLLNKGIAKSAEDPTLSPDGLFVLLLGRFGNVGGSELTRLTEIEDDSSIAPKLAGLIILVTLVAYIRAGSVLLREPS